MTIIRIKRSETSGNPETLAAGELAYSGLPDSGSNGGDRLYIGMGTETNENAVNHVVIGGKYFTDMMDHTKGVSTASSALITDADNKIDLLNVDDITLNGSELSTVSGNLELTPGSGTAVVNGNLTVDGDLVVTGATTIQGDITGTSGTATALATPRNFSISGDGSAPAVAFDGTANVALSLTLASVNSDVGTYGSATAIPSITVDAKGRITSVSTNNIATSLDIAGDTGADSIALLADTLTFTGSTGIETSVSNNTLTIGVVNNDIKDIVGTMLTGTQSGITVAYDSINHNLDFTVNDPLITIAGDVDGSATMTALGDTTITVTLDSVNADVGSHGSATAIPVITVDAKGRVTSVSTQSISSSFNIAAETGTAQLFDNGSTLTFAAGEGINTAVTTDTITISAEVASSSNLGVASFNTSGFNVSSGDVTLKANVVQSVSTDSGAMTPTSNTFAIYGGEGVDVTHSGTSISVSAEIASSSNLGVATFNTASFDVSGAGDVTIKDGGVTNSQLVNNSVTVGTTTVALGGTSLSLAGLQQLSVDNITINGNEISSTDTNGDISLNPNGTGTVEVNGARITGVASPTQASDAANKEYVDAVAQGIIAKPAVHAATTTNLSGTYDNGTAGAGATLNLGPSATLSIDGHNAWDQFDGILVKNQTNAFENGRYYVSQVGDGSTDWILTRCGYCDEASEIPSGFVYVQDGNTLSGTGWVATVADIDTFTVGVDSITWVQFSGAGTYIAGNGLSLTGSTFSVNTAANGGIEIVDDSLQLKSTVAGDGLTYADGVIAVAGTNNRISVSADAIDIASTYVGQASITTLGTVTTGTWNATTIATTKGGTGLTSYDTGDILYASSANTLGKLTKPATNALLVMGTSGTPSWMDRSSTDITGLGTVSTGTWQADAVGPTYGGTGLTSYAKGDLIYASATNTLSKISAGGEGQVLVMNSSGIPAWTGVDGGTY